MSTFPNPFAVPSAAPNPVGQQPVEQSAGQPGSVAQPAPQPLAQPAAPLAQPAAVVATPSLTNPFATVAPTPPPVAYTPPAPTGSFSQPPVAVTQTPGAAISNEINLDETVESSILDKFPKMAKGQIARVAFTLFDEKSRPIFRKSEVFYSPQTRLYFRAPTTPTLLSGCMRALGDQFRVRLSTILLMYNTDQNGQLIQPYGYKLFAYVFNPKTFNELKLHHAEWGLHAHDLLFTCTNPEYSTVQTTVTRECFYRSNPALIAEVTAKARELYDSALPKWMGNIRSDADIVQILNGVIPATTGTLPSTPAVNPFAIGGAQPVTQPAPGVGSPATTNFADIVASQTQRP